MLSAALLYPFLPLLDINGFEVRLEKVVANIAIDLVLKPQATFMSTKVLNKPFVASKRCEDVMFNVQALLRPAIVSIVDIFENRSI